jgi:hypothetical protein
MKLVVLLLLCAGMAMGYDADKCGAFAHKNDPPFPVPAGGTMRLTVDCSHCGGLVQNYNIYLMSAKRRATPCTLAVFDQNGVRQPGGDSVAEIGSVPDGAVYSVVVTNPTKKAENCLLDFSGAI